MSWHQAHKYHWDTWSHSAILHRNDPINIKLTIRKSYHHNFWNFKIVALTPKMTNDAPVSVAEWPPLGVGGTPSIYGKAQSHYLSTIIIQWVSQLFQNK